MLGRDPLQLEARRVVVGCAVPGSGSRRGLWRGLWRGLGLGLWRGLGLGLGPTLRLGWRHAAPARARVGGWRRAGRGELGTRRVELARMHSCLGPRVEGPVRHRHVRIPPGTAHGEHACQRWQ